MFLKGLFFKPHSTIQEQPIKVVRLKGVRRMIYGPLLYQLDMDYTQPLHILEKDIESALQAWCVLNNKKFDFLGENKVCVYRGSHHLDIIKLNKGSLNLLKVEDHLVSDKA